MILIIYLSFLLWAASGVLFYIELGLCVLSTLGVLIGAIFCWSSKVIFSQVTMVAAAALSLLGAVVLFSTVNRDHNKTNVRQLMIGLALPTLLTSIAFFLSYFKLCQLKALSR